jgi:hypothetical protein
MDTADFLDRRQAFQDAQAALALTVARLSREGKPLDGDESLSARLEEYELAHDAYYAA